MRGIATLPSNTLLGKISRYPLRILPSSLTVPILKGPLRGKKWVVGSQRHAFWLGIYEPHMQDLISRKVKPDSVFYDIGSNVGFYSLLASKLVGSGRVFAFEPLPANLARLRKHLDLNGATNVSVLGVAVSDRVGTSFFEQEATGAMGRLQSQGSLEVETTTLDALLCQGALVAPNYIKMDIEGAEAAALRGARVCFEKHRPVLFLATHGHDIRQQCSELLRSFNYRMQVVGNESHDRAEILAHPQ